MVHTLVPSDRVEAAAVYGRDDQKIGTIERLMLAPCSQQPVTKAPEMGHA